MMMVVAVLEGVCSFLAAETWLRTGPRPTMMDTELHAAGGYVCLPQNRYRSHVVQSRGLQLAAAEAAQQRNYVPASRPFTRIKPTLVYDVRSTCCKGKASREQHQLQEYGVLNGQRQNPWLAAKRSSGP